MKGMGPSLSNLRQTFTQLARRESTATFAIAVATIFSVAFRSNSSLTRFATTWLLPAPRVPVSLSYILTVAILKGAGPYLADPIAMTPSC